jgi:hypothetical protein
MMNEPRLNLPELTVSELSAALKRTIEESYGYVRVRGELGKVSYHGNGHVYFDLKDDRASIAGVIWRSAAPRIRLKLEAGLEVVITGRLTTYPGRSQYQIVVETLEPAGLGALMALLEERKKRLTAEGLFDEARKQLLPYLPAVIGVITSPTGAVIRDILHRLADRFPRHVLVWPVKVQGDGSAAEVAAAIAGFNALAPSLPSPARGGGKGGGAAVASVAAVAAVAAAELPAHEPVVGSAELSVPARALESFEDLVALAAEKRDLAIKSALERDVRLVRFEDGRLEIGLESSAPKTFTGELSKKLGDWTGRRWMVIVSAEPGLPSLYAQAQTRKAELKDGVRGDPLVQAVLARFPGAEIVDVRPPASAPAALDEMPYDAPGEAGRADDEP